MYIFPHVIFSSLQVTMFQTLLMETMKPLDLHKLYKSFTLPVCKNVSQPAHHSRRFIVKQKRNMKTILRNGTIPIACTHTHTYVHEDVWRVERLFSCSHERFCLMVGSETHMQYLLHALRSEIS